MNKTLPLAAVAGLACCSIALAKPPLKMARPGNSLEPVSVAKVKKVNGQIVLDGPWIPYDMLGHGPRTSHIHRQFFDCFGASVSLQIVCGPGTQCIPSCDTVPDTGGRWFFGSTYHMPQAIEDMQDCACPPGSVVSELNVTWMWCPNNTSDNCILVYFPLEEVLDKFGGVCNDPASFTDTGGGGVAINFGAPAPSCPGFYYFSCVSNIEGLGMLAPSTDDNGDANGYPDGSYQMIIANSVTSSEIVLAAGPTQPMMWGTSEGYLGSFSTGPADCRPGLNNDVSYDDDAPADGTFANPAECYDNNYGVCPDPLGKANLFGYLRCKADYNNDGFIDGIDADQFNNAFDAGSSCADLNGDCFIDGIDSDFFNNEFDLGLCT